MVAIIPRMLGAVYSVLLLAQNRRTVHQVVC